MTGDILHAVGMSWRLTSSAQVYDGRTLVRRCIVAALEDCDFRHVYAAVVCASCATLDGPQWLLVVQKIYVIYVIYDSYRSDQGHSG